MDKLKNLWEEIVYQVDDFVCWLTWKFPYKKRVKISKATTVLMQFVILIMLITLIIMVTGVKQSENISYTIIEVNDIAEVEPTIDLTIELGKAIKQVIKTECARRKVDIDLVYAIINSPQVEDGVCRYGIMKLHPDLIKKYNANYRQGVGIVESIYSNAVSGIERLAWCLENNETIEGALMAYIYTKPQAQEMWSKGIKTTDWVNGIKEELK